MQAKWKKWVFWPHLFSTNTKLVLSREEDVDEFHHLVVVNRLKPNETLAIINTEQQQGVVACVKAITKKEILLDILEPLKPNVHNDFPKRIALITPLKLEPFQWQLEKLTELSVNEIWVYESEFTQPHFAKKETTKLHKRFHQIMKAAASQCERWYWPELHFLNNNETLTQAIENYRDSLKILAVEREIESRQPLNTLLENHSETQAIIFATGPEGGLSEKDLALYGQLGFKGASLGNSILRAETASLFMASCIQAQHP